MEVKNPNPNPNPSPNKPKLAIHFFTALDRISHTAPNSSSPLQRRRRIRRAAYASMAYAAGPSKAWSRALLRRLRSRSGAHPPLTRRPIFVRPRVRVSRPRLAEPRRADDLRKLLPGGKTLDFCSLLEETADFIQYLGSTVRLMQSAVDSASRKGQEP